MLHSIFNIIVTILFCPFTGFNWQVLWLWPHWLIRWRFWTSKLYTYACNNSWVSKLCLSFKNYCFIIGNTTWTSRYFLSCPVFFLCLVWRLCSLSVGHWTWWFLCQHWKFELQDFRWHWWLVRYLSVVFRLGRLKRVCFNCVLIILIVVIVQWDGGILCYWFVSQSEMTLFWKRKRNPKSRNNPAIRPFLQGKEFPELKKWYLKHMLYSMLVKYIV